ncbi:MAG: hypothetical protein WB586_15445 [Chthoniobacterales bacterium]|jgi:hypothetical protein
MEFHIKCRLGYEVAETAAFLFDIAVAQNSFQRIIKEHFEVAGAEFSREIVIGDSSLDKQQQPAVENVII